MRLTPVIVDFTSVFVQRRSVETAPFFLEHFVILGIADMLFLCGLCCISDTSRTVFYPMSKHRKVSWKKKNESWQFPKPTCWITVFLLRKRRK